MEITWETLKNIPGEALDQLVLDDAKIAIYGIDKDGNQTNTSSRVVAVATITPWGKFFPAPTTALDELARCESAQARSSTTLPRRPPS